MWRQMKTMIIKKRARKRAEKRKRKGEAEAEESIENHKQKDNYTPKQGWR